MNTGPTIKPGQTVPELDLSPRLQQSLSAWRPLDNLRLLYWVFFSPQSLRWYLKTFGGENPNGSGSEQNRLIGRIALTLLMILLLVGMGLSVLGAAPFNWFFMLTGVVLGAALGARFGWIFGIVFGGVFSLLGGVLLGIAGPFELNLTWGLFMGITLGTAAATAFGGIVAMKGGVDDNLFKGVSGGLAVCLLGLAAAAVVLIIKSFTASDTASIVDRYMSFAVYLCIGCGAAYGLGLIRFPGYIFRLLYSVFFKHGTAKYNAGPKCRVTFWPLPGIRKQLEQWLETNWETGLRNANQLLRYTMQFVPVVRTVSEMLERSSTDVLLTKIAAMTNRLLDWDLIRYCSASLKHQLLDSTLGRFISLFPGGKERSRRLTVGIRTDTPARAACAGLWYWHKEKSADAMRAFAKVQDFRHGTEFYHIARAISLALGVDKDQAGNKTGIDLISQWPQRIQTLEDLPEPELRVETLTALRKLQSIAGEIGSAGNAISSFKRARIAQQVMISLHQFISEEAESCPQPEWPLIKKAAEKWRNILENSGWLMSENVLEQPVENPYKGHDGRPVTGDTFVGRREILGRIETFWTSGGSLKPLVLYGHRRMGKTSVLKKLEEDKESNLLFVYLSMQDAGLVDHAGILFLEFAEAIHKVAEERGLQVGAPPDENDYKSTGGGRRALNSLLDRLDPQMNDGKRLVLAIDEFEYIWKNIKEHSIDKRFLDYLRATIQQYAWLGLVFAGLHAMEEMMGDQQEPFYSQAESLRLTYLDYEETKKLIIDPRPRFALEYADELVEELFRLTYGQPYLIQYLCWKLVTAWNDRFEKEGKETPRKLTLDDLPPTITSGFFRGAEYYFVGVWKNVTENAQHVLRIMAEGETGAWTRDQLDSRLKKKKNPAADSLEETLKLLKDHDVILEEQGRLGIASVLMRRWVADGLCDE